MKSFSNSIGRILFPFILTVVVISVASSWAMVMGLHPAAVPASGDRVLGILLLVFFSAVLYHLGAGIDVDFSRDEDQGQISRRETAENF